MASPLDLAGAAAAASATAAGGGWGAALAGAMGALNNSRLAWGVASVLFNLASRHVLSELTPAQSSLVRHPMVRRVAVVAMLFMATRDLLLSVALGVLLLLALDGLLNENSRICVLPAAMCGPARGHPQAQAAGHPQAQQPKEGGGGGGTAAYEAVVHKPRMKALVPMAVAMGPSSWLHPE